MVRDPEAATEAAFEALSEVQDAYLNQMWKYVELLRDLKDGIAQVTAEIKADPWWNPPQQVRPKP